MNSYTTIGAIAFILLGTILFSWSYGLHSKGVLLLARRRKREVPTSPWAEDMRERLDHPRPLSRWYGTGKIRAYLRMGRYHLLSVEAPLLNAIGVSNVSLVNPEDAGQGYFKEFITGLEAEAAALGYAVVRIEEVHDEKLLNDLLKHGYLYWAPGRTPRTQPYVQYGPILVKYLPPPGPVEAIYTAPCLDFVPEPGTRCITKSYGPGTVEEVGTVFPFQFVRVRPDLIEGRPGYPMNFAPENVSVVMPDGSLVPVRRV